MEAGLGFAEAELVRLEGSKKPGVEGRFLPGKSKVSFSRRAAERKRRSMLRDGNVAAGIGHIGYLGYHVYNLPFSPLLLISAREKDGE